MTKVSVITVCLNEANDIGATLESVIGQRDIEIELIVVDGGSTDGTLDVVNKYSAHIARIVSEADNGIFDAMNKGLRIATAEWVIFMNAGDSFVAENALSNILCNVGNSSKVVYGNKKTKNGSQKPYSLNSIRYGVIPFCHQAVLLRRDLGNDLLKFRDDLKLYGDYEVVARIYKKHKEVFQYIDADVCVSRPGGVSSFSSTRKRLEKYLALFIHFGISGVLRGLWMRMVRINNGK